MADETIEIEAILRSVLAHKGTRSKPRTPKLASVKTLLTEPGPKLKDLVHKIEQTSVLMNQVRSVLPDWAQPSFRAAFMQPEGLVILVNSGPVASRLLYDRMNMLQRLREIPELAGLASVSIKSAPGSSSPGR